MRCRSASIDADLKDRMGIGNLVSRSVSYEGGTLEVQLSGRWVVLPSTLERIGTVYRLVRTALPAVDRELGAIRDEADSIVCPELRWQALQSIDAKRFHCQGGSVYSCFPSRAATARSRSIVSAIVALQTVSDYLDNLCDRTAVVSEPAFRRLHRAFTDALVPSDRTASVPDGGYYDLYPYRDDADYLRRLVDRCRSALARLPSYPSVAPYALRLGGLYADLQSLKHLEPEIRAVRLQEWVANATGPGAGMPQVDHLFWWEFAAACGSTLGIFALFSLAADTCCSAREVEMTFHAYFPYVCGLHILLDYLIDLNEDATHGDFNFVASYANSDDRLARLESIATSALRSVRRLQHSGFHTAVVQGLLALYLSDPKVAESGLGGVADRLLSCGGPGARLIWHLCRRLRRLGRV